jgi:hypothetical protein
VPEAPSSPAFDPVDLTQLQLLARLSPGRRVGVMLDAQAFGRGIIWGRLRRRFPQASQQELAARVLEELERADHALR